MNKQIIDRVTEAIRSENATFMFGAGISMYRRSACPGWQAMVTEIIGAVAGDAIPDPVKYVEPHLGLLFNETFFQIMYRTLPERQTIAAIRACLDAPQASRIHRFIAWCANQFDANVLTSNFDELIERSGLDKAQGRILKLHGTLMNPGTLRFTANTVFAPLDRRLAKATRRVLKDRTLIVAGYGGWDHHDIMPVLFQQEMAPRDVIWVHFPGDPPDARVCEFFTGNTTIVSADIDRLFQRVYRRLAKEKRYQDGELARWGKDDEQADDPDWWMRNVGDWADDVRQANPDKMRLLWARLADHVRLYQIDVDGERRNLADEAYESIKSLKEPALRYEALSRAAYMGRTMGRSKQAVQDLQDIIGNLRREIAAARRKPTAKALRDLLAWCLHQRGAALQGERRFREADRQLAEAISYRVRRKDPNLEFSEFQRYMNGRRALEEGIPLAPDFYDLHWQRQLAGKLDAAAKRFQRAYQIDDYAQTLHNAAFVYQSMAEDARRESKPLSMVVRSAERSLERYETSAVIRESLRDPRMIAQSKLRLAQVEVLQASNQLASHTALDDRLAAAGEAIARARGYADDVRKIYDALPQEAFRYTHVENVVADCDCFVNHLFNRRLKKWLPDGPITRLADFDEMACAFRADRRRGWHLGVLTAVFDESLRRVLMVHLGDYARKSFADTPWVLPGGSVEANEKPSAAAARELLEETGVRVDRRRLRPVGWFPRPDFQPHHRRRKGELLLLYAVRLNGKAPRPKPNPPEVVDARFAAMNLKDMIAGSTAKKLGGVLPARHVYWARVAQAALRWRLSPPRTCFYGSDNTSMKPWLNIERSIFEIESFF